MPNDTEAEEWKFWRDSVGLDALRPNVSSRRDDNGGGYNKNSKWHYTLPLYVGANVGKLEDEIKSNPSDWGQMFPQEVIDWLLAGKAFATTSLSPSSEENKESDEDA